MNMDRAQLAALDASSAFNTQATVHSLIKERAETHGDFDVNSEVSQAIKAAIRYNDDQWASLTTGQREALDHMAGKIGRIIAGDSNFADHWVDIRGYAQLVIDRLEGAK